ncbi:MAG TPA: dienelactone hydrolase family protein [Chitinophagaceae bacterium]|nr:dienelactone hydrolase family protein [Chitinophagaceae bacterium]
MDLRFHKEVTIPVLDVKLKGNLIIPVKATAIIIFSHGSGSSRLSSRNQMVAKYLHQQNFGTLLFDLLTEEEDSNYQNRFDIELLTKRLIGASEWLQQQPVAKDCRFGYFGASTGAASALKAASYLPQIDAVVSRGGRPDLAMNSLPKVNAATLLIVGAMDFDVLRLTREAYSQLSCEKKLEIIEGATHLFEEPGKMEKVAMLAADWFEKYLHPVTVKMK